MTAAPPALRVERARLINARPGDRQRLAGALDLASPAATGVGERALLLIPKLRVERPLAHGIEGFAAELIDRIRAARFSARRGLPVAEGGVCLFEDEVALEVAIVRFWLAGARLPEGLRRAVPLADAPVMRWRRHVFAVHRLVPRVVAFLMEAGLVTAWLARFTGAELRAAADNLARAYGYAPPGIHTRSRPRAGALPRGRRPAPAEAPPHSPWAIRDAAATARALAPDAEARVFLITALLAARQPALVATQAFAAAFAELSMPAAGAAPVRRLATPLPKPAANAVAAAKPRRAAAGTASTAAVRPADGRPIDPPPPRGGVHPAGATPPRHEPARRPDAAPPEALIEAEPAPPASEGTASPHAGLFFLLNVFLALGLYGDFTDLGRLLRGLSPFELLLLLGQHWLGREFETDPIVPVLRTLAGLGARGRPGRDFEAPAWRVPADWLTPWPRGRPRRFRSRHGTSRWHGAGFPVADRWHLQRPAPWLRRRWVACLACYIEARLRRAFGMSDARAAVALLIARPGTVHAGPEHIEIVFGLEAHPLAIRLAGLDRDPGWIPAAGRSIGFRFG